MAVSVLGGMRLVATSDDTISVVVAARDLPANHIIELGDLQTSEVRVSQEVLEGLVRGESSASLTGSVVLSPVAAHGLIADSVIADAPRAGRDVTVPVSPDHALGTALRVGDRVDVLGSFDKGTDQARTLTIVQGAEVIAIMRSEGLFGQEGGAMNALTLSVAPADAVALVFALRNAEIDILRSTGSRAEISPGIEASALTPATEPEAPVASSPDDESSLSLTDSNASRAGQ